MAVTSVKWAEASHVDQTVEVDGKIFMAQDLSGDDRPCVLASIDGRTWCVQVPAEDEQPHRFWVAVQEAIDEGMEVMERV